MAYREITMIEVKEVLRQWLTGVGKKRIAARVGLEPKTVRRYARAGEGCGLAAGQGEAGLTDEVPNAILATLCGAPARQHGEAWQQCEAQRAFVADAASSRTGRPRRSVRLRARRSIAVRRRPRRPVPRPPLQRLRTSSLALSDVA